MASSTYPLPKRKIQTALSDHRAGTIGFFVSKTCFLYGNRNNKAAGFCCFNRWIVVALCFIEEGRDFLSLRKLLKSSASILSSIAPCIKKRSSQPFVLVLGIPYPSSCKCVPETSFFSFSGQQKKRSSSTLPLHPSFFL